MVGSLSFSDILLRVGTEHKRLTPDQSALGAKAPQMRSRDRLDLVIENDALGHITDIAAVENMGDIGHRNNYEASGARNFSHFQASPIWTSRLDRRGLQPRIARARSALPITTGGSPIRLGAAFDLIDFLHTRSAVLMTSITE